MPNIAALAPGVIGKLRSSTIITSVAEVVEELVCNSIDAGARSVIVHIDPATATMRVEDNGSGISCEDMKVVGERHATSKIHTIEDLVAGPGTLGFRGEAVSSLCEISVVEITSRSKYSAITYTKVVKGGTILSVGIAGNPMKSAGTICEAVSVKELFYNQPVRRRVLLAGLNKQPQNVKERVYRVALMHPSISFKVIDSSRQVVLLNMRSSDSALSSIQSAFGEPVTQTLGRIHFKQSLYEVTGYISGKVTDGQASKGLQYFYINKRFVQKTPVHKLLNSYYKTCYSAAQEAVAKASSARKQMHPAFVLDLTCPLSEYDITFEASKTIVEFNDWAPVLAFVRGILADRWGPTPQEKLLSNELSSLEGAGVSKQTPLDSPPTMPGKNRSESAHDIDGKTGPPPKRAKHHEAHDLGAKIRSPTFRNEGTAAGFRDRDTTGQEESDELRVEWTHGNRDRFPGISKETHDRRQSLDSLDYFCYSPRERLTFIERESLMVGPTVDLNDRAPVFHRQMFETSEGSHQSLSPRRDKEFSRLEDVVGEREQISPAQKKPRVVQQEAERSRSSSPLHRSFRFGNCSPKRSEETSSPPSFPSTVELTKATEPHSSGRYGSRRSTSPILRPYAENRPASAFPSAREILGVSTSSSGEDRTCRLAQFSDGDVIYEGVEAREIETSLPSFRPDPLYLFSDDATSEDHSKHNDALSPSVLSHHHLRSDEFSIPKRIHRNQSRESSLEMELPPSPDCITADLLMSDQLLNGPWSQPECSLRREMRTEEAEEICHDAEQYEKKEPDYKEEANMGQQQTSSLASSTNLNRYWLRENAKHILRRSVSGPPFYRGRNRHGVHGNPMASLVSPAVLIPNIRKTERRLYPVDFDASGSPEERLVGQVETEAGKSSLVDGSSFQNPSISPANPHNSDQIHNIQTPPIHSAPQPPPTPTPSPLDPPPPPSPPNNHPTTTEHKTLTINLPNCLHDTPVPEQTAKVQTSGLPESTIVHASQEGRCHSKWREGAVGGGDMQGAAGSATVASLYEKWQNPCMRLEEPPILDLASITGPSSVRLVPTSMTKAALQDAVVMEQVDKKFIPIVASDVLLLVDQHAADERVRLEDLRLQVLKPASSHKAAVLDRVEELFISMCEEQAIVSYQSQIEFWGWRYKLVTHSAQNQSRHRSDAQGTECSKLRISAVPNLLEVKLSGADLSEFLRQLMETEGTSSIPPKVIRLLNSKACRGAIMFGDALQKWECRQVVDQLKLQQLCFQCAHGRPTMIPLVNLGVLRTRFESTTLSASSTMGVNTNPPTHISSGVIESGGHEDEGFKTSTLASKAINKLGHVTQHAKWSLEKGFKRSGLPTRLPRAEINKLRSAKRLASAEAML